MRNAQCVMNSDFPAEEVKTLSPLVLAHIGDAYFHLYVRTRLLQVTHNITRLHDLSAEIVSATAQAKIYHAIENFLTDDERDTFRRGRNAKSHAPRKATVAEYHASTGFEALLGELYLKKNFARLDEICELAFKAALS
ncbi:MAG: ribonuclease III [Selenomonadaceae bacterium]|nr:ribonuclease III [Selenomonadaceae bacterium]MBQ6130729.1 ribonuclease III [Selenomonadaceae bacterium]MBQ7493081.1 ribonuclease III [Selenomonadaceae bacterium]